MRFIFFFFILMLFVYAVVIFMILYLFDKLLKKKDKSYFQMIKGIGYPNEYIREGYGKKCLRCDRNMLSKEGREKICKGCLKNEE